MAGHRAQWKGSLKVGKISCDVTLYTAASTSDRITFNTINIATGNRVSRIFIDSETEKPVEKDAQIKGFELEDGRFVLIDPEEIEAAVPDSDKTLDIEAFIPCSAVDNVYFDKPYYLTPDKTTGDAFAALRDGMKAEKVAAIARTVLFRRMRTVLIRPYGMGMIATTLQYDYEIRSAKKAFEKVPKIKIEGEMLDLAKHIIGTKMGEFDPATFDDRYEETLAELVKAKIAGKALPKRKKVNVSKPSDLLGALRESAGLTKASKDKPKRTAANVNKRGEKKRAARGPAGGSAGSKTAVQRKTG
jgi:DNA end-binding protein Ku